MCREKSFAAFPNKRDERAIRNLHVFCTNKDKGCDWQGEMNSIVCHLANSDGCQFEEVSCSNQCGLSLQRQLLSKHVDSKCPRSQVTCQYCNTIGERQFINGQHHKEECPKFPLPCHNKCDINTVPRQNMEAHRAECPLEMIQCECNLSLQRQHLSKHADIECPRSKVTCQYCNTTGERQFISGQQHEEECPKLPLSCPNKCEVGIVLRENMEAHRAECPLEIIQCEYYEMGCTDNITRKDQVKHNKEEMENHLSLMKSEYLHTKGKLADAEKRSGELESAMEHRIKESEIQLQQKAQQLVENMMFKHVPVFQWYTTLEGRVKSQCVKIPVTLKISEHSKKKESDSDWYSGSFSWELSVFDQYPEMKLRVIPAGCDDGKGTHLSVQLYLVKGGRKRDFIALEQQIEVKISENNSHKCMLHSQKYQVFGRTTHIISQKRALKERLKKEGISLKERQREREWERQQQEKEMLKMKRKEKERLEKERERLKKEKEELREKQKLWQEISLSNVHVMILNQITDSEHYCVQTNQIDLTSNYFLTNKHCNVLIFDSPCFISNEVLYKSTATCRYLKDDNIYFLIKAT